MGRYGNGNLGGVEINGPVETTTEQNQSGFGESLITHCHPKAQIDGVFGIREGEHKVDTSGTGTAYAESGQFYLTTGATIESSSCIKSRRTIGYRDGQATHCRITAGFDKANAVAGSQQFAGIFNQTDGYMFGYNGTVFGLMRRNHGSIEARLFTFSAPETGEVNVTVTLNSVAFSVPLTAGTAIQNARELAAFPGYTGWRAYQVDNDKVCFIAETPDERAGTFSYLGTGSAGTFTALSTGLAPNEDFVPQAEWNMDRMDGKGPSGMVLSQDKGNIYRIIVPFLGYGPVEGAIMLRGATCFNPVHRFLYPNGSVVPHQGNPNYKVGWEIKSISSTVNLTMFGASAYGATAGENIQKRSTVPVTFNKPTVGGTEQVVFSIRNTAILNGVRNSTEIIPRIVTMANDGNKTVIVTVVKNAILTDPKWQFKKHNDSAIEFDEDATARTNGREGLSFILPPASGAQLDLGSIRNPLQADETLSYTAITLGGGTSSVTAGVVYEED